MVGDVDYRQALGRFPTGVTVVTVADGDERFAMTASALTSVSLDPILLLVCFGHETATGERPSGGRVGLGSACSARTTVASRGLSPRIRGVVV